MLQSPVVGDLPAVPDGLVSAVRCSELPDERARIVRNLSAWMSSQDLPLKSDDDAIKFAHSCDYDLERAKVCARGFFSFREETPELFSGWDTSLPNLKSVLDVMIVAVIPNRTPENCRVVVNSLHTSDTSRYVFVDVCKILLMVLETIFLTEPDIDGIIFVHDMSKTSFSHFWKFGWSLPKKFATYTQDLMPLKQHMTHLVNCSAVVDRGVKMLAPLGSKEQWEKMRAHKVGNTKELLKHLPPNCVPRDLDGSLPSLLELHDLTVQRLGDFKEIFRKHLP